MPRGAQVIYPKDLGPILMLADIAPGCGLRVGHRLGGALDDPTAGRRRYRRLRAPRGLRLARREERRASSSATRPSNAIDVTSATATTGSTHDGLRPGRARSARAVAGRAPRPRPASRRHPGGLHPLDHPGSKTRDALDGFGFAEASTMEVLNRRWHIEGNAVRPDHRMVAHTGFLTRARCPAP